MDIPEATDSNTYFLAWLIVFKVGHLLPLQLTENISN